MTIDSRRAKRAIILIAAVVVTMKIHIDTSFAEDKSGSNASMQELLQKIKQRDELIDDLKRRVEALEQGEKPPVDEQQAPKKQSVTNGQPAKPENQQSQSDPVDDAKPSKPGQFIVDEEAAERALDRTLVQSGVLLLSPGTMEVEPSLAYTRSEFDSPNFLTEDDRAFVVDDIVRRDVIDADLSFRVGMPSDSQFEFRLPYRYVDQSEIRRLAGAPNAEQSKSASGLGDVRLGLAKTLTREKGWKPDLVGRLTWDTDSGESSDNGVPLSGNFNEIIATLSAVKRQDPLAFIGALSYSETLEKNNLKPGSDITLSLGAALAASPETSLRFVFDHMYANEAEIDGNRINGSDDTVGTLTIGASSIIGRRTLLDISANVGLTDSASDYALRLSIGRRFGSR